MAATTTGKPNRQLYTLCNFVMSTQLDGNECTISPGSADTGEITPDLSAEIVQLVPRTGGYLRAIQRSPQARTAIEAGCGPTAVFSLGLGVFHPHAEIIAYELNHHAARCAESIIDLMGMGDQISVRTENVLTAQLPRVDLAVTETFNKGLAIEQGAKIAHRLTTVAGRVLPAKAIMYAQTGQPLEDDLWQPSGVLNFTEGGDFVEGSFASRRSGHLEVSVRADYLDADNQVVVGGYDDTISYPLIIGTVDVPAEGTTVNFRYPTGHIDTASVARIRVD